MAFVSALAACRRRRLRNRPLAAKALLHALPFACDDDEDKRASGAREGRLRGRAEALAALWSIGVGEGGRAFVRGEGEERGRVADSAGAFARVWFARQNRRRLETECLRVRVPVSVLVQYS
jgi:hypothetical protein